MEWVEKTQEAIEETLKEKTHLEVLEVSKALEKEVLKTSNKTLEQIII